MDQSLRVISAFAILASQPCWAYLDPGTGSILIQGLLAAIAAAGVTMRFYWDRVVGFFKRNEQPIDGAQDQEDAAKSDSSAD